MKPNTWMKFHIGDYLRDTGHLSTCEHGAYVLLLFHAFTHGGVLPNDEVRLRNIAKMSVRDWNRSSHTLRAFFYVSGDTLRQRRIDRELGQIGKSSEQKSMAGKASAVARATQRELNGKSTDVEVPLEKPPVDIESEKENKNQESLTQREAGTNPRALGTNPRAVGTNPKALGTNPRAVHAKARTQIEPGWKPTSAGIEFAKARGIQPTEVQAFRDFHAARGNTMADWDAAWRTWCNNSVKFRNNAPLITRRPDEPSPMIGGLG